MKFILPLIFLAACSTPQTPKQGTELIKGATFDSIKEARDNPPDRVISMQKNNYYLWDGKILAFKDDKYQHTLESPAGAEKYKLAMESAKIKNPPQNTVFLKQWNKERDTTEWGRLSGLLADILAENGYTIVTKPEEAQQTLRVSYGVLAMEGGNYRYLNLNSIDAKAYLNSKKENSYWKTKVSSWGTGKDIGKILPVMLYPINEFLKKPETKVSNPVVDSNSFDVLIFNDYFEIK